MQLQNKQLLYSATDLANQLSCPHLTQLNRRAAFGELKRPHRDDPLLDTLIEQGQQHEKAYVDFLKNSGMSVIDVGVGSDRAERTVQAMRDGADVIVQAELHSEGWLGYADILLRVIGASDFGDWSYEVADTKLATHTKGTTVLQLCFYSDLLAQLQGVMPEQMAVVKPGRQNEPFDIDLYRVDDYLAYYRTVKQQLQVAAAEPKDTYPEPVAHCEICNWWTHCNERRRADDHLTFVAGIRSSQITELRAQQRPTLKDFATAAKPLDKAPERGSVESFAHAHKQAQLQHTARQNNSQEIELLEPEDSRGLRKLPEPDAADVFFDIEGARHAPGGGLEYLLGYVLNEDDTPTFHEHWALTRAQEKQAFETFVDYLTDRWQQYPGMHIYHYAHYEQTAIKQLAMKHATREDEVDRLLRAKKFIDLYAVVRQGLMASVESYSIKKLEPFYGYEREEELSEARHGLQRLERSLELANPDEVQSEDQDIVRRYNKDDCISTLKLRDWLETLRQQQIDAGHQMPRPELQDGGASQEAEERNDAVSQVFNALIAGLPEEPDDRTQNQQARWLLAYLLDYFRREDKCVWWEYFRMHELLPDDLMTEKAGLAGLQFLEEVPGGPRDRNPTHRYCFSLQEAHLSTGNTLVEVGGEAVGTVAHFDLGAGILDIKKRGDSTDVHPANVFVFDRVRPQPLPQSLLAFAEWVLQHDTEAPPQDARYALLAQQPPRLQDLQLPMTGVILDVAVQAAGNMQSTVLPIQGPPGAGKTYLGSNMIARLVADGKRVGVTAISHKVIANLLESVVRNSDNDAIRVAQRMSKVPDDHPQAVETLKNTDAAINALDDGYAVGGTAWLWASDAMAEQLDYLFIDEAGQMSLAIALAAGRSARNIVLLGDPQQLEQPQQGSHPEGAEIAALNHLLQGRQTIPEDRGLFIPQTWRLNPAICQFTSEQFYEGRLSSRPGLECQVINGTTDLPSCGLAYLPVEHAGNQNRSEEEAAAVALIVTKLTDGNHTWVNSKADEATVTLNDIVIVAPFNAQVATLRNQLPDGSRIGTVDKFQGQEAAVVIYSITSSSAEDAPRGMSFLYSPNRLNVATSRAQCLVILVASPAVFSPECHTPEHIKLANAFCRYLELSNAPVGWTFQSVQKETPKGQESSSDNPTPESEPTSSDKDSRPSPLADTTVKEAPDAYNPTSEEPTAEQPPSPIEQLYQRLKLPEDCRLGNRVYKKLFYENANLGATDKKAFTEDIDLISWMYTLKPNSTGIQAFVDNEREYEEVAVLQVDLKTNKRTGRIAQVIHRAIPYPLIVVFRYESSVLFSLAPKRYSQAEKGAIVAEEFYATDWVDPESPQDVQNQFLDSIAFDQLPKSNFLTFYSALVDRLLALDCSRLSGDFRIENTAETQRRRREQLAACHELELKIAELRAAIKKETRFNRQVELNTKIKHLTDQLKESSAGL